MRFPVLFLAMILSAGLIPYAARAQGEQSVRINADGSFTIIDAPGSKKPKAPKPPVVEPVQKQEERRVEKPEPAPVQKPKKIAVEAPPVEKPKPVVEEERYESVFAPEPVEEAEPVVKKPAPVKKVKKKAAPAPKVKPKPQVKPAPVEPVAEMPVEEELPYEEGPLTRDDALRIAIQVAPPFKRSTVLPGNYNGRPVYEVILQTEDGDQSILVDAETGELVTPKKKKK